MGLGFNAPPSGTFGGQWDATTACWQVWVRVHPKASSTEAVVDEQTNQLHVYVTAVPVEGAANAAVVKWFAKQLGIPLRCVVLRKGQTAPLKCIEIQPLTAQQLTAFWANIPKKSKNTD